MSTFADFSLLAAVPSYGGAEILRAQRALPMGPGPRVHLALFGRQDVVTRRVVAAANAAAAVLHPAFARIYEVSRFDGVVYGVGDPAEGADLVSLLHHERQRRRGLELPLAVAITATLARVVVALHDAAGPGFGAGAPRGIRSVLPGGLTPDVLFLEPTGAVRVRLLAGAAADPNAESAFLAPENLISMPADVHELGRLLMALLTGDATGRSAPRLARSSPLSSLLPRLIDTEPGRRPHLHEVVMTLEQLVMQGGASSPDQVIRQALADHYRPLIVDPMLTVGAPPRLIDEVRFRLAYIYPAIERLWPSLMPTTAPPMAALPAAVSGEGGAVFTDARPAVRRPRAKTAATMLIPTAGLVSDMEADPAIKRPTQKTVLIPTADMLKALPESASTGNAPPVVDAPIERTRLIDPSSFTPFSPPPAEARSARAPDLHPGDLPGDDLDGDSAFSSSGSFSVPTAPPSMSPPPVLASPDASTAQRPAVGGSSVNDAVFASSDPDRGGGINDRNNDGNNDGDDESGYDDDAEPTQMLNDDVGGLLDRLRAADAARLARLDAPTAARLDLPSFSDGQDPELDGPPTTAGRPRRSSRSASSPPPPTAASTTPPPTARPARPPRAATIPAVFADNLYSVDASESGFGEPPAGDEPSEDLSGDFANSFAEAFGPPTAAPVPVDATPGPGTGSSKTRRRPTSSSRSSDGSGDPDELLELDDAGAFILVGEGGQSYDGEDNPFAQSTRVFHAQAMQRVRDDVGDSAEGATEGDGDGDDDDARTRHSPNLVDDDGLDSVEDTAFGGMGAMWATAASRTGAPIEPSRPSDEGPATEMVDAAEVEAMLAGRGPVPSVTGETPLVQRTLRTDDGPAHTTPGEDDNDVDATSLSRPRRPTSGAPQDARAAGPRPAPRPGRRPGAAEADDRTGQQQVPRAVSIAEGALDTSRTSLVVEAAEDATVALNGTVIGTGTVRVEIAGDARAVVRVTQAGHAPWSTVVSPQGRPRVRVRPVLKPLPAKR